MTTFTQVLGENSYAALTDEDFIREFDRYMRTDDSACSLSVHATFNIRFLIEYDRRFRPVHLGKKK